MTVFTEIKFWLLIAFSIFIPFGIYGVLMLKRAISRRSVFCFGLALVAIAGLDFYLLQSLANLAKHTVSLADDSVFVSELTIALYIVPAMFGGIGINVISHVLIGHLSAAERRFAKEHPQDSV